MTQLTKTFAILITLIITVTIDGKNIQKRNVEYQNAQNIKEEIEDYFKSSCFDTPKPIPNLVAFPALPTPQSNSNMMFHVRNGSVINHRTEIFVELTRRLRIKPATQENSIGDFPETVTPALLDNRHPIWKTLDFNKRRLIAATTIRNMFYVMHLRDEIRNETSYEFYTGTTKQKSDGGADVEDISELLGNIKGRTGITLVGHATHHPDPTAPATTSEKATEAYWLVLKDDTGALSIEVYNANDPSTTMPTILRTLPPAADFSSLMILDKHKAHIDKYTSALIVGPTFSFIVDASPSPPKLGESLHFYRGRSFLSQELLGCPASFCYSFKVDSMVATPTQVFAFSGRARYPIETSSKLPFPVPSVKSATWPDPALQLTYADSLVVINTKYVTFRDNLVGRAPGPDFEIDKVFNGMPSGGHVSTAWVDTDETPNLIYVIKESMIYSFDINEGDREFDKVTSIVPLAQKGLPKGIEASLYLNKIVYLFKNNFFYEIPRDDFKDPNKRVSAPRPIFQRTANGNGFFETFSSNLCDHYSAMGVTPEYLDEQMAKHKPDYQPATTTTTPSSTTTRKQTPSDATTPGVTSSTKVPNPSSNTGTVVGIIVGVLVLLIIIAAVAFFFYKRQQNKPPTSTSDLPSRSELLANLPSTASDVKSGFSAASAASNTTGVFPGFEGAAPANDTASTAQTLFKNPDSGSSSAVVKSAVPDNPEIGTDSGAAEQ